MTSDLDPREAGYGYYSIDELGVGVFVWETDATAALRRYAGEELPQLLEGEDDAVEAVRALLARAESAGQGLDAVVGELNAITDGTATLAWWGTFEALSQGDEAFARDLRSQWREGDEDRSGDASDARREAPVEAAELGGFVEFLADHGH